MYAFCNATGTLQEDQVLTCEDYDQSRSSMLVKNGLTLSEEGDDNTINISWTTGKCKQPGVSTRIYIQKQTSFLVTAITEEVNEEQVLETIQDNFEKATEIVPEDQLWIPTDALESIKHEISEIEDIDDIKEEPEDPEEPEDEPEDEPMDMELVILFSVFSVAEAFTIVGLSISICQSEWVAVSFFGVLLGVLRKQFFLN